MLAAERAVGRGNYSYANGQFSYYSANQVELFRSSWKNGNQYGVDIYYGMQYQKQILGNGSGSDFIYDNNNAIALGMGIVEPGFGAAWDAVRTAPGAYTNGAKIATKAGGAGLVGLNVALTGYTISREFNNGTFNTHSIVNGAVTVIGTGLTVAGLMVSAPAVAIIGAGVGITYGIAQIAGADAWIDNRTLSPQSLL